MQFMQQSNWGSEVEVQTRLRIKLSIAAYAYEVASDSIMSDAEFDSQCLLIDPSIETGNSKMDKFFKEEFNPSTGQWIHKHPDLATIVSLYRKYYASKQ
jgi:hypothetical protein